METTVEKIGPEEAQRYLATMGPPSYPVDPALVASFAARMKSGVWVEGPEPLLVEVDPEKMIGGRRRMLAVVESGATVEFSVLRGEFEEGKF